MKKITSIGLVLIMSFQCCYQLGVITYFHLNGDYIAEVLCINKEKPMTVCHGQCFLERNLDLADDAPDSDGTPPAGKQKIDFPVFLVSGGIFSLDSSFKRVPKNFFYKHDSSPGHTDSPFHPPTSLG